MKICTPEPLYKMHTPEGTVRISHPRPGDQLSVNHLGPPDANGKRAITILFVPIIGWARGMDDELSIYTVGPDSSKFRLATEEGAKEEYFFGGQVPETLYEHRLDEYGPGTLTYLPAPLEAPAQMEILPLLRVA
ncbi:hypothetical protein [Hymenobacter fodinae]|uniref:Uncharacterized protein n=1 Tax=Hymenobacter fodinae TaxID=2510796 RepID=A0A4Z0PA47_9BACT|nr:hypothetical protein [Hymenobacter fodinae]TGE08778.1 hypothetical protein EU556_13915 [Hymenobacter fodinae]